MGWGGVAIDQAGLARLGLADGVRRGTRWDKCDGRRPPLQAARRWRLGRSWVFFGNGDG